MRIYIGMMTFFFILGNIIRWCMYIFLCKSSTFYILCQLNYRTNKMSRWTPEHSVLLSQILDNVTGTQDIIEVRKDYCKLLDCIDSTDFGYNEYFTGSMAEGLDLPGSDEDYMRDAYDFDHGMQIIEQDQAVPQQTPETSIRDGHRQRPASICNASHYSYYWSAGPSMYYWFLTTHWWVIFPQ